LEVKSHLQLVAIGKGILSTPSARQESPNPSSVELQRSAGLGVAVLSHKSLGTETEVQHHPQ